MQKTLSIPMLIGAIFLFNTVLANAGVSAQDIVEKGNNNGAMACAGCHGSDGAGNNDTGFPRLAGLHSSYIAKQLNDFKSGKRDNPIMNGVARALSDTEIQDLANYFAALNTPAKSQPADKTLLEQGKKLAVYGNWDNDIPACFRCHGDQASGGGPVMPALAGQHKNYIQAQLQAWKNGARSNDPVGLMSAIAGRLSDAEIKAVSTYLSNLTPAVTQ